MNYRILNTALICLITMLMLGYSAADIIKNSNSQLKGQKPYTNIAIIDHASAGNLNVLVDKFNQLPSDYVPKNLRLPKKGTLLRNNNQLLRDDVASAWENLYNNAKTTAAINIGITSAYRSYKYQYNLYNSYVKKKGRDKADKSSARPGHSEHQTGLTLDWYLTNNNNTNCNFRACLERTKEYKWLDDNMHKYGFILSYPKDKQGITLYIFEPWHIRYVGVNLATILKEKNLTLGEWYKLKKKI